VNIFQKKFKENNRKLMLIEKFQVIFKLHEKQIVPFDRGH